MKPKVKRKNKVSSKPNPFQKKSSHSTTTSGIPTGVKLKFYSQLAKDKKVDTIGKWDVKENKWVFTGDNPSTINWLISLFSKPITGLPAVSQPKMIMRQDNMAFVYYLRDVIMPRKKMVMVVEGV